MALLSELVYQLIWPSGIQGFLLWAAVALLFMALADFLGW